MSPRNRTKSNAQGQMALEVARRSLEHVNDVIRNLSPVPLYGSPMWYMPGSAFDPNFPGGPPNHEVAIVSSGWWAVKNHFTMQKVFPTIENFNGMNILLPGANFIFMLLDALRQIRTELVGVLTEMLENTRWEHKKRQKT